MKGPSWLVAILTFVLEIIAFGLALGAMVKRSKATLDLNVDVEQCLYSGTVSSGLAAGAIILLFAGQAVVMGTTGCLCCSSGSFKGKSRGVALLACILAWITFVLSEVILIAGAAANKVHTHRTITFNDGADATLSCKEVRKSVFAAGAAFIFLTLVLSEIYYFALVKASEGSWEETYKTGTPTINMTSYT